MKTFQQLYWDILKQETGQGRILAGEYKPYHMDCLLHPERFAPVVFAEDCEQCAYDQACRNSCIFDAFEEDEEGKIRINKEKCIGCGACVDACRLEKLAANKDVVPVLRAVLAFRFLLSHLPRSGISPLLCLLLHIAYLQYHGS